MNRLVGVLVAVIVLAALLAVGCNQGSASPTQAPSQTKAAEATKAASPVSQATAQPTTASGGQVGFPDKGKTISLIVPFPPGGSTDVGARLLAPLMEKELGVPIQVVNKAGAGSQVGITELAQSKPDGYTLAYTLLPATVTIYLDPERKAVFGRKDLQFVATHVSDPQVVAVAANSPYRTLQELLDAAKANPEKIKASSVGVMGPEHLSILQLQKAAGVKFAIVQFEGSAPATSALLGGHTDFQLGTLGVFASAYKNGQVRFLGVMDKEESRLLPGVKTTESQGYKIYSYVTRVLSVPAGTPAPVVDVLSSAVKKAMETEEHKKKIEEMGMTLTYMGPDQTAAFWDDVETQVKPLMELAK
ncbi:MAG: tripartite tricarboxylate transporter substrate binding protein [Sphingomonadaceae bacterium]